jgi:hypothetical protein
MFGDYALGEDQLRARFCPTDTQGHDPNPSAEKLWARRLSPECGRCAIRRVPDKTAPTPDIA